MILENKLWLGRPARSTTGPGDYTAKEKERLALEHADEIAEAQAAKGLQTKAEAEAEANGVWNPMSQEVMGSVSEDEVVLESLYEAEVFDPSEEQARPVDAFRDLRPTQVEQKPLLK